MHMTRAFLFLTILGTSSAWVQGSQLFDAGPGTSTSNRPADFGPGTGVSVTMTTDLTQMAISLGMPNGGDIKYMIWDSTNTNLLFSETQAVAASNIDTYVLSPVFSFTLIAGNTYYFAVIGDSGLNVDYIFPATSVTQNGLTTLASGNTNYDSFANPVFDTDPGATTITLQLFGTQDASTPEPAAFLTVAAGLGLFLLRKRS
jgi:hypothetical protein